MKKVEQSIPYREGKWASGDMIKNIENTIYGTLEKAIGVKKELIKNFEEKFGYARDMNVEEFDYKYAYNLGLLDGLLEHVNQNDNGEIPTSPGS